jgi:hypothetical protein
MTRHLGWNLLALVVVEACARLCCFGRHSWQPSRNGSPKTHASITMRGPWAIVGKAEEEQQAVTMGPEIGGALSMSHRPYGIGFY